MDSDRRGFFKRLLGLGAAVVAAPVIAEAVKAKAEVIAAEKVANPMLTAAPHWSADGRYVQMIYTTTGTTTTGHVTCYVTGAGNWCDFEVKNG